MTFIYVHKLTWTRCVQTPRIAAALLVCGGLTVALAACGGASTTDVSHAGARQTISLALSGLDEEEGPQIEREIKAFERHDPQVRVKLDVLSPSTPDAPLYLEELEHQLRTDTNAPDLMELEVTQPQMLAKMGWIRSLTSFKPDLRDFFAAEVAAGELAGTPYAIPWTEDPEGLFYRTDLVRRAPRSPSELLADAEAAPRIDRAQKMRPLNEPFAFAGYKNEAISTLEAVAPAFGGGLTAHSIDTKGNVEALDWLRNTLYRRHVVPRAAAEWDVGPVQDEFSAGRTAFAIDYPFVADNRESGSPATDKLAYIPFPPRPGGRPGVALGGEMLAISARSRHAAAAYRLIEYLTSAEVQRARAEAIYTPPALRAAYTGALYTRRPLLRRIEELNEDAQPGLLSPQYPQIADAISSALAEVLGHGAPAGRELKLAATQIRALVHPSSTSTHRKE